KTALVHEYVWRTADSRRERQYRAHNNVWLLSPQRLISGMTYVGQWESRLLAILAEAKKRDHVLYFASARMASRRLSHWPTYVIPEMSRCGDRSHTLLWARYCRSRRESAVRQTYSCTSAVL